MFQIDLKSRKAIYEQVTDNFKRLIVTGILKQDEKVPSVRDMAKTLTVNPNTVQKAYRELESQGYFYTVLGQGNFIAAPPDGRNEKEISQLYSRIRTDAQELLFRGETKKDITRFIEGIEDNKNINQGGIAPDGSN
ncbi:MAG: GntR family transcriptional regulator [Defluviitaleaceae bacterium]|nr:GntR family transcriptional regulator [Defluviitaleaceae bacterium]